MGQAHSKASAYNTDRGPFTSIAAVPTVLGPHDISGSNPPAVPEPPMSSPILSRRTEGPIGSREGPAEVGDQRSPHSKKSIASGTRQLARKLSSKAKLSRGPHSSGLSPGPSVAAQMKAFEEMVAAAEQAVGISSSPHAGSPVKGSPLSGRKPRCHSSQGHLSPEPPGSAPPLPTGSPPFPKNKPPQAERSDRPAPLHHRRSSSGSTKSDRTSTKPSARAEREWRARVAAIARSASPQTSIVLHRGPVPPKRTPARRRVASRGESPDSSDLVVTPSRAALASSNNPAESTMSNQSFTTLGLYAAQRLPLSTQPIHDSVAVRGRKASVPRSVLSSLYFDSISNSKTPSRPPSLAANHLLDNAPRQIPPPLRKAKSASQITIIPTKPTSSNRTTPTSSFPSFEVCDASPSTAQTSAHPATTPALPDSAVWPPRYTTSRLKRASAPADSIEADLRLKVSINQAKTMKRYNTISPQCRPGAFDPLDHSVTATSDLFSLARLPRSTSSLRTRKTSMPSTPISPTTAFLMTAPLDSLNLGTLSFDSPGEDRLHPYSLIPAKPDPQILLIHTEQPGENRLVPFPLSLTTVAYPVSVDGPASFGPFSPPPTKGRDRPARPQAKMEGKRERRDRRTNVLQAKRTQPTEAVLGSAYDSKSAWSDLERQREKMRKLGVDLTPGMEDGRRPPKSGLPRDVSDRQSGSGWVCG